MVLITALLGVVALQNSSRTDKLATLDDGLASLQSGQNQLAERLQSSPTASMQAAIEDLYTQVALNRQPVASKSVSAAPEPDAARPVAGKIQDDPAKESSAVFNVLRDRGQLYSADWREFGDDIHSMSKEESRQFWQQMFAAIETGDVQLIHEE